MSLASELNINRMLTQYAIDFVAPTETKWLEANPPYSWRWSRWKFRQFMRWLGVPWIL